MVQMFFYDNKNIKSKVRPILSLYTKLVNERFRQGVTLREYSVTLREYMHHSVFRNIESS